jgi:transcriptional regulator with XRE-family HTH domain
VAVPVKQKKPAGQYFHEGQRMNADWFAARLRELRTAAGLTQQQLAQGAGLSLGAVRDLEQGRTRPTWETVLRLAGVLGVTCDAFTQQPAEAPQPKKGRPKKPRASAEAEQGKPPAKKRKGKG